MSNGTDIQPYEEIEGEIVVEDVPITAVQAITAAEISTQVATANKFKRKISTFLKDARELACLNPEVAEKCYFTLPRKDRDGKFITGPSVRLAEIIEYSFRNLRVACRIVEESDRFVVAQAVAMDLERNNGVQIEVRRGITYSAKNGKPGGRFSDDMIQMTANSAISVAYRNGVFRIVPRALWQPIEMEARRLVLGKGRSIEEVRKDVLEWIKTIKVTPQELFAALEVGGVADIGLGHLETLAGFRTALNEHLATVDDIFRPLPPMPDTSKHDQLKSSLKTKAESLKTPAREPGDDGP